MFLIGVDDNILNLYIQYKCYDLNLKTPLERAFTLNYYINEYFALV